MSEEKIEVDGVEIDAKKARNLLTRILVEEKINISTGQKSDTEMINEIKKEIEEEVKCY